MVATSLEWCASHWDASGMPVCPGKLWGAGDEAHSGQVGQESTLALSERAQCCSAAGSDSEPAQFGAGQPPPPEHARRGMNWVRRCLLRMLSGVLAGIQ